jgi:transketolase
MLAGHMKLDNLCVMVDNNCLGGIGKTDDCCSLNCLKEKFESFGLTAYEIDGHDEERISSTLDAVGKDSKPVGIVCNTVKGKGISFMEHDNVWHYRPVDDEWYEKTRVELDSYCDVQRKK